MENLFKMPKKIIVLGSLFFLFSCAQDELLKDDSLKTTSETLTEKWSIDKVNVFKGPNVAVGNGTVRSWISLRKETGLPYEIGIEMTPGALELDGLPDEGEHTPSHIVPLHPKAKQLTPFDHLGLNWQNHGHPANPKFLAKHFDIHFYMISVEDRLAILPWSLATNVAFNNPPIGDLYIPSDYVKAPGSGSAAAQMGKHWLPLSARDPNFFFDKIMVYGTYDWKFIFVEPMITLDYLLSTNLNSRNNSYTQPILFEKAGYYPTMYNIYRDPKTGNTNITLSGFNYQVATPRLTPN